MARLASAADSSVRDGVRLMLCRKSSGQEIMEEEESEGSFFSNRFRNFPFRFLGVGVRFGAVVADCCCCPTND